MENIFDNDIWKDYIDNYDINDIPNYMCDKQYVSYTDYSFISTIYDEDDVLEESFEQEEKDFNNKQSQLLNVVFNELKEDYHISDWQFAVDDKNKVVNGTARLLLPVNDFSITIPDIDDNIDIIEGVMKDNGYYVAKKFKKDDYKKRKWIIIIFNPVEQYPYNNVLIEEGYKYLIHSAPIVYKPQIDIVGIWPRDSKDSGSFKYTERTFFAVQNTEETNTEKYEKMMNSRARRLSDINPSQKFIVYIINISEIINNVKFYRDPNFLGACYTNQAISPKYLKNFYIRTY